MSLKCHTGFVVAGRGNALAATHGALLTLRGRVFSLAGVMVAARVAQIASDAADLVAIGRVPTVYGETYDPRRSSLVTWADGIVHARHQRLFDTSERDPMFDFDCAAVAWPSGPDALVMLETEFDDHLGAFASVEGVTRYPYWDNADRPSEMDDGEWDRRGGRWRAARSDPGLRFECLGRYGLPAVTNQAIARAVPQRSYRARRLVLGDEVAEVAAKASCGRQEALRRVAAWARTNAGAAALASATAELELVLPIVTCDLIDPERIYDIAVREL